MITAIATADDGTRLIMLGLTRANLTRLAKGEPILIRASSHPGFPEDLRVAIVFGETERTITDALKNVISEHTKIVTVPRTEGEPS